jgi:RNA polymerase sigma factor (sigma-70 family)
MAKDSIQTYLRSIGRYPLLSADQEKDLATQVQKWQAIEKAKEKFIKAKKRSPLDSELSNLAGLSLDELKRAIVRGMRAHQRMMQANLRLVVSVAKKYQNRGMELQDLIQEGSIGLHTSVLKFDPSKGYKFSTYAYWWIRQSIVRGIDNKARTIRIPIHIVDKMNRIKKARQILAQQNGRSPSIIEIEQYLGWDYSVSSVLEREELVKAKKIELTEQNGRSPLMRELDASLGWKNGMSSQMLTKASEIKIATEKLEQKLGRSPSPQEIEAHLGWRSKVQDILHQTMKPTSLNRGVGGEKDHELMDLIADSPVNPEYMIGDGLGELMVEELLEHLSPRERMVIERSYGIGCDRPETLAKIGRSLNLSSKRIRQIQVAATRKLRRAANVDIFSDLPAPESSLAGSHLSIPYKAIFDKSIPDYTP